MLAKIFNNSSDRALKWYSRAGLFLSVAMPLATIGTIHGNYKIIHTLGRTEAETTAIVQKREPDKPQLWRHEIAYNMWKYKVAHTAHTTIQATSAVIWLPTLLLTVGAFGQANRRRSGGETPALGV